MEQLVKNLVVLAHEETVKVHGVPESQPCMSVTEMSELQVEHFLHVLYTGKEHHCHVCQMKMQVKKVRSCKKHDCSLCCAIL